MEYYSQIGQDQIVDFILNKKENGFFLDIGAQDSIEFNNTYFFEKNRSWNGFAIEINSRWNDKWNIRNKTNYVCSDARNIDYNKIIKDYNIEAVDYISLDLDPPNITLEVLNYLLINKIYFKVMTFEVDVYRDKTVKDISRKLLIENGYELLHELYYTDNVLNNVHVDDLWINKKYIHEFKIDKNLPFDLHYNLELKKFTNINEDSIK